MELLLLLLLFGGAPPSTHWTSVCGPLTPRAQISGFPAAAPRDHSGLILLSFPASARHIPEGDTQPKD